MTKTEKAPISISDFKPQALILAIVCLIFYGNTFSHEFAFDDMMAIVDNNYVQQGVSGIGNILTKDAFQSYQEQRGGTNELSGGRYRPLSLITFAIEQQALGTEDAGDNIQQADGDAHLQKIARDMHLRHVVNVLLYILSVIALLQLFRRVVFKDQPMAAFVAALLFAIHPLHTEVVANVKSRDEILSVLFIALTFLTAFGFQRGGGRKSQMWSLICFFLALLSKEYAALLIVLLPLSFYIFEGFDIKRSLKVTAPYLIPFALYLLMRFNAVTGVSDAAVKTIQNYPYLYASPIQKLASEFAVLLRYLELLIFPHPLAADYSYRQIPYSSFADPVVWVSVIVYAAIIAGAIIAIRKRHLLGFAAAIYLAWLLLVSNLFFNIGAPMGERLAFHSSIGFCIVLGFVAGVALKYGNNLVAPASVAVILIVITAFSGYATVQRNADWKNNETLFLHDVTIVPNSALVNLDAGASCMSYAKSNRIDTTLCNHWFAKAIGYFTNAIRLDSTNMQAYLDRGVCYFNSGMGDRGLADWDTVRAHDPLRADLSRYLGTAGKYFASKGLNAAKTGDMNTAVAAFHNAIDAQPENPQFWLLLARAQIDAGANTDARLTLQHVGKMLPGNESVKKLMADLDARDAVK